MLSDGQVAELARKHRVSLQIAENHSLQAYLLNKDVARSTDEEISQTILSLRQQGRYYTATLFWILLNARKQGMSLYDITDMIIGFLHSDSVHEFQKGEAV